jgi:hypothetical protein
LSRLPCIDEHNNYTYICDVARCAELPRELAIRRSRVKFADVPLGISGWCEGPLKAEWAKSKAEAELCTLSATT